MPHKQKHAEPQDQPELLHINIRALLVDQHNHLWVGHRQGLLRIDLNQPHRQAEQFKQLHEQSVLSLSQAADGSIWIGTANAGVLWWQIDNSELHLFPQNSDPSIAVAPVHSILHAGENDIWLAALGGVEQWPASTVDRDSAMPLSLATKS